MPSMSTGINLLAHYQSHIARTPDSSISASIKKGTTATSQKISEKLKLSTEARALHREYTNKERTIKSQYYNDKQKLDAEYQREKQRLDAEYQQKKHSLGINIYA